MINQWDILARFNPQTKSQLFTLVTDGTEQDARMVGKKLEGYVQAPVPAEAPFVYAFELPADLDEDTLDKIRTAMEEVVEHANRVNQFVPGGQLGDPLFSANTTKDDKDFPTFMTLDPSQSVSRPLGQTPPSQPVGANASEENPHEITVNDKDMLIKDMEGTLLDQMPVEDIFAAETKYDMFFDIENAQKNQQATAEREKKLDNLADGKDSLENSFDVFQQKIKEQTCFLDLNDLEAAVNNVPPKDMNMGASASSTSDTTPANPAEMVEHTAPAIFEKDKMGQQAIADALAIAQQTIEKMEHKDELKNASPNEGAQLPDEVALTNTQPHIKTAHAALSSHETSNDDLPEITIRGKNLDELEATFNLETTLDESVMRTQYEKSFHNTADPEPMHHTIKQLPPQMPAQPAASAPQPEPPHKEPVSPVTAPQPPQPKVVPPVPAPAPRPVAPQPVVPPQQKVKPQVPPTPKPVVPPVMPKPASAPEPIAPAPQTPTEPIVQEEKKPTTIRLKKRNNDDMELNLVHKTLKEAKPMEEENTEAQQTFSIRRKQSATPQAPGASAPKQPPMTKKENTMFEKTKTIDHSIELPLSELKKHNWPLEVPLLPIYTMENMVMSVNRFAHATAISVIENPGKLYNPLVFHGATGTGKTHFLNAMAYALSKKYGQENIFMTNGVRFSRGIQRYAVEGNLEKFQRFIDTVKVLLIDDIHLLAVNEQNRKFISNLLNKFLQEQKQIIITSKYPPESLEKLEELLHFKLDSGWISELKPAGGSTHLKIVKKMLLDSGVDLNDNQVSEFFGASHMTLSSTSRNIHRLKVLENLIFPNIPEQDRSQAAIFEKLLATNGEDTTSQILQRDPDSISSISTVGNGEWGRIGFFYPQHSSHMMNWMVYALQQRAKELHIPGGFEIAVRSSYATENIISSAFKIANLCDNKKLKGAVILGPAVTSCDPSVRENFYDILTHMLEIMLIRCGIISMEQVRQPSTYVKIISELLR